jgi:hypothetical protein
MRATTQENPSGAGLQSCVGERQLAWAARVIGTCALSTCGMRPILGCALLVLQFACCTARAADPAAGASAVITELAASLTAGNVQMFMASFDPSCPGYAELRNAVQALASQGETQSYVEVVKNEGDDRARTLEATWELRIRRESEATPVRREARVTCKMEIRGKRWRIVSFAPVDFLTP